MDAFISYRRESGFYLARLVRDQLEKRGISSFLDLEELRSGEYEQKLYEEIQNSQNFILILPNGALNHCIHEDDWLRKEIFAAIKAGSTIIPILSENFKWPRKLYDKLPEEIKSLEYISGVKVSKEYLNAMIDRLVSFMHGVKQPTKENAENRQLEGEYISAEKYFSNEMQANEDIETVDMAFHAGADWFTCIEKNDLLYDLVGKGTRIRVLLNEPETSELIARHMRHQRKRYMSFDECIQNWNRLKNEYPDNEIEIRLADIPILRRYYSFHMKEACMDTVNVKHYTYGNAIPEKNYQSIFHSDSPYFMLYRGEFEYLWEHATPFKCASNTPAPLKIEAQWDTAAFFNEGMKQLGDVSGIDMFFRAGSEWHLNSGVVELLSCILEKGIRLRVIINERTVVEETAALMRQPLKKYYGYDKSLADWQELAEKYPELISVRVADVPLMRRYHNIKGKNSGIAKVSYYTYGNYSPGKDYQRILHFTDKSYGLYAEEFDYLWEKGSHEIKQPTV